MKTCTKCHQFLESSEFTIRRTSKDGLSPTCRVCQKLYYQKHYAENKAYRIAKVRSRTIKNQAVLGAIKVERGCTACGLKDDRPWLFDFDHLSHKVNLVSRMMGHKLNTILEESLKCQVLCSNCHRTETYRRLHNTLELIPPAKAIKTPMLMRNWYALLKFKQGPCTDCHRVFHPAAMDCDHVNPAEKLGEPSNMARQNAEGKFLAELAKCVPVCSNCHRIRAYEQEKKAGSSIRQKAQGEMKSRPGLSYQRAIRELIGDSEQSPPDAPRSMKGAYVTSITKQQARSLILKYEWLGTMGRPQACYGLWFDLKDGPTLAGAVCFGLTGGTRAGWVCGQATANKAIALERGACVHWAPRNAASWFIPKAVKMASKDHGWKIFYAYADPAANEIGTIYQACNWLYLGQGPGHGLKRQKWSRPDGVAVSSRALRARKLKTAEALAQGWKMELVDSRGKYVWFEGGATEKKRLRKSLIHPIKPYPRRSLPSDRS